MESYKIVQVDTLDNESNIVLNFLTETSTGPAGEYKAELTLKREGDFWRLSGINASPELYPYTGYKQPAPS